MEIISNPFTQINRQYRITSKELKKLIGIDGEVISMCLYRGRSPNQIQEGKSPDKDIWEITTKEVIKK